LIDSITKSFFNNHSFGSQLLLGIGQLFCHISIFYVLLNFSYSLAAVSLFMYFLMTCVGVSITAHRFLTHHSFSLPRYFEILGSLLFTLSLQGSTVAWVAMHREHHSRSDTERDPHCPKNQFFKILFFSMFYTPKIKYAVTLFRDPFHRLLHRYYWPINITFSLFLYSLLGLPGIIYLHLFPAFLCWHAIGVAKTLAHSMGYRNFNTKDSSTNIHILGYLTFGEAWHNNHHANPGNYTFKKKGWEIDISATLIQLGCKFFGFNLKRPS